MLVTVFVLLLDFKGPVGVQQHGGGTNTRLFIVVSVILVWLRWCVLLLAKAVDANRVDAAVATAMIAIMDKSLAFMYIESSQAKYAIYVVRLSSL